ncbi:response regulator [Paenibacillus sp. 2TAB23]|uniref:response regulator n=1 Tax=Paenibacillus sp. 2TAB23 TaxID=3233004 RepID=UPI003F9B9D1B
MLKVLIVEDEIIARSNIKLIMNWEHNGYRICGEAKDGIEALDLIRVNLPDIVFTAVQMPRMGGVELTSVLSSQFPSIQVIVLSQYDDYQYVCNALKNGAIDFILKQNLSASTILETLDRAREFAIKKSTSWKLDQNSLLVLRNKFMIDLLSGLYREEEFEKRITFLDIQLDLNNIRTIMMMIDEYKNMVETRSFKEISMLHFSVLNIVEEILKNKENGAVCHVTADQFVIFFSYPSVRSSLVIEQSTYQVLDEVKSSLKKYLNLSVSFSIGPIRRGIEGLKISYVIARKLLSQKFYHGKSLIITQSLSHFDTKTSEGISLREEKSLLKVIKLKDKHSAFFTLDQIFESILKEKLDFQSLHLLFNDLISIVNRACKETRLELTRVYGEQPPSEVIRNFDTLDDAKRWFHQVFVKLFEAQSEADLVYASVHVNRAIAYIQNNYAQELSLVTIAQEIRISSVHLSKEFKEKVGIGVNEYLSEYRMKRAAILLEEGEMDLRRIAENCGFRNYPYFFKVFKKRYNLTPKQYMNSGD